MSEFRIGENAAGQRLDKFTRKVLKEVPLSAIYKLIRTKKIRVNGKRAEEAQVLAAGDVVTIRDQAIDARPDAKPVEPTERRDFKVLHEDSHILVCVKPSGLAVHPGTGVTGPTLVDQVRSYLGATAETPGEFRPAPAHRLDRETSGVVVVAKTRAAIVKLSEAFAEGTPKKLYVALAMGQLDREGTIDVPLAEHQQTGASKSTRGVNMQEALTHWKIIGQAKLAALVEVEIETGRTHQIRRHFAAIGHPIVGDDKHGDFPFNRRMKADFGVKRLFLHAARLGFAHPVTGQAMTFRAPIPVDLCEIIEKMGLELPAKFARDAARPERPGVLP